MISGAHCIIYSKDPEADRRFFRDVLGLPDVDVGGGWLIFGLPASELAVHPAERNNVHEIYFLCDDIDAVIGSLAGEGVAFDPVSTRDWGRVSRLTLPGGGTVGIYEPRHERPPTPRGSA